MDRRPDAIEILVSHQAAALVRYGRPMDLARKEAEDIVDGILVDLGRIGLEDVYLGVALRRAHVYRLRCGGATYEVVCKRLGISRWTAERDYNSELQRRRVG